MALTFLFHLKYLLQPSPFFFFFFFFFCSVSLATLLRHEHDLYMDTDRSAGKIKVSSSSIASFCTLSRLICDLAQCGAEAIASDIEYQTLIYVTGRGAVVQTPLQPWF